MYFSDENTLIRLEILGYEFNTFSYDEDADWLNVKIEVNDKKENLHWTVVVYGTGIIFYLQRWYYRFGI